jgi:hypothetical protein
VYTVTLGQVFLRVLSLSSVSIVTDSVSHSDAADAKVIEYSVGDSAGLDLERLWEDPDRDNRGKGKGTVHPRTGHEGQEE